MAKQSPLDVTSLHFTRISACVQVVYWYLKYQSAMQHIEIISQEKLKVKCACRALCSGVAGVRMMVSYLRII